MQQQTLRDRGSSATTDLDIDPRTEVSGLISIVAPVFDEEDNLVPLCSQVSEAMAVAGIDFEMICVNDGSRDNSLEVLTSLCHKHEWLKVVDLARNYGQTAAIMAGVEHSRGSIIVFIDADLQNDPQDIPLLIEKLGEGFDMASGWRQDRKDAAVRRNLVSRIANRIISSVSGVHLHDYGCTLKAYRRSMVKDVKLYGEMHRFLPIYASWLGARITEMPVRHRARVRGKSKYGLERIAKVILDLLVVVFLEKYLSKPMYVFGGFGIFSTVMSVAVVIYMFYLKFFENTSMIQTPLPVLAAMLFLVGIVSILMGLVAEIVVRTYFQSHKTAAYHVRGTMNIAADSAGPMD